MNATKVAVILAVIFSGLIDCHSQENFFQGDLKPDVAEDVPLPPLNLPLLDPASVPAGGNYFSAFHTDWPPLPAPVHELLSLGMENAMPIYSLAQALGLPANAPFYLCDDRAYFAAKEQADKEQVALKMAERAAKGLSLTEAEPSKPLVMYRGLAPVADDLQVDIEDVTNGIVSLNILNPTSMTNPPPWDVWMATQFSGNPDNWTWIARTEPGQTNLLVAMPSETEAYFRLGSTNNDVDGDGILDSWMSQNFAHVTAWASDHTLATNDFDGDGYDNATAFANGTSPNILRASTHFPSLFVNQRTVSGTCAVAQGVPFYLAVLVDSTNFADAQWQPYTGSNISLLLPDADGNHQVRVLLRSHPADATPIFEDFEITLDRVAPVLAITNPVSASATVTKPYLQLLGNANEPLSGLSYDITNAAGTRTNLMMSVIDQAFDTNTFDFTTNYFQAYDVALVTNVNYLTLRVTDRAGNTTTTNLTVTLDYTGATNPPVLQMTWPTNGMAVSGDSFTLRGQLSDETAGIVARVVDGGGLTNEYAGIVERSGTFWLDGLPMVAGTNQFHLIATDAAGNVTTQDLTVLRSELAVAITSTPTGESLWDGAGTVSGTVGESGCSVSVNGVTASVTGTDWTANNVPIYGEGVAVFDVIATPASGPAAQFSLELDKPSVIKVTKHYLKQMVTGAFIGEVSSSWTKEFQQSLETTNGVQRFRYAGRASAFNVNELTYSEGTDYTWSDADPTGTAISYNSISGSYSTNAISDELVRSVPDKQVDHSPVGEPVVYVEHYYAKGVRHPWPDLGTELTLAARTEEMQFTGGRSGGETLYQLSTAGVSYGQAQAAAWYYTPATDITDNRSILGEPVDIEGKLLCLVADNSKTIITTKTPWKKHYKFKVESTSYPLAIMANDVVLDPDTVTNGADFCVGQEITFEVVGLLSFRSQNDDVAAWKLPGTFVNTNSDPNCDLYYERNDALLTRRYVPDGTTATRCWYVLGESKASVSVDAYYRFGAAGKLFKQTLTGKFNVHRPTTAKATPYQPDGTPTAQILGNLLRLGNGNRSNDMSFSHTINLGNFSGKAGYTQLVTGGEIDTVPPFQENLNTNIWLDREKFYRGEPTVSANTNTQVEFYDGHLCPWPPL